jgi:hypothetical protein
MSLSFFGLRGSVTRTCLVMMLEEQQGLLDGCVLWYCRPWREEEIVTDGLIGVCTIEGYPILLLRKKFEVAAAAKISRKNPSTKRPPYHLVFNCSFVVATFPPPKPIAAMVEGATDDEGSVVVAGVAQRTPRPVTRFNILFSSSSDGDDETSTT